MSIRTLGYEQNVELDIFVNFQVDKNLKKNAHLKKARNEFVKNPIGTYSPNEDLDIGIDLVPNPRIPGGMPDDFDTSDGLDDVPRFAMTQVVRKSRFRSGLIRSIFNWIYKLITKKSVEKTFNEILGLLNEQELKLFTDDFSNIDKMISEAETSGQKHLVSDLKNQKSRVAFEKLLKAKGITKYLTEAQVLEFGEKCDRDLCLDLISNFIRTIPSEVVAKKKECDDAMLFDNYCILYYAASKPSVKATNAEVHRLRDPILFGIVKESRKLYFVADWNDELCDLTLEAIVEKNLVSEIK